MHSVVVVGAINVDLVVRAQRLPERGETVVGGEFQRFGGGKGANAAVAAARQGVPVRLVGAVGRDDLGAWSRSELAVEGVDLAEVADVDAPTGVALIVVDHAGENQIAVGPGANDLVPTASFTDASRRGALFTEVGCVLVSTEIAAEAVRSAVEAALDAGVTCVVNPAPVTDAVIELVGRGAILTPNRTELRQLAEAVGPTPAATSGADVGASACALAQRNGAPVVVTLGAAGVGIAEPGATEMRMVPAIDVPVVDTTGAGDTFNGIFAVWLAAGASLYDAVARAAVGASLSVGAQGARGGMPNAAAVAAAFERVKG